MEAVCSGIKGANFTETLNIVQQEEVEKLSDMC